MEFHKKFLKNSPLKPVVRFRNNFTEMFLGWPFLVHLSTTRSRGALRVIPCPSCVVRHASSTMSSPKPLGQFGRNLAGMLLGRSSLDLKLSTEFDSIKNSGCHGNEIEIVKQFFKNLLLWNCWSNSEMISQECSYNDHFQK